MSSCNIDFVKEWDLRYQGAESKLYFGNHSGNPCVIKHRFPKGYRHPILDKKLTKERTKRERRMIEKIASKSKLLSSYMPKVVWSNDSTIIMTEITNCETLNEYIEKSDSNLESIAKLIGQTVAELHNLGLIHGDLTTSNLLLKRKSHLAQSNLSVDTEINREEVVKKQKFEDSHVVVPIDFGLSTGSYHPEERAVDLYVLERAILSTHFSDSKFFGLIFDNYLEHIDETTCEPAGKAKIMERLREVRARGRKSEYIAD